MTALYLGDHVTSIILPNSLKSLTSGAFCGCINLTSIYIPSSVTYIGPRCFNGCMNLKSLTIPVSVETISESCFEMGITINYLGTESQWNSILDYTNTSYISTVNFNYKE